MAPRTATVRALVVVTVFGLAWAHALGLTQFADPRFIDWMIEGDWMGHLFGWLFAKVAPWSIPLAQAPDLVAPSGSSAALTDAIPLLTVIGKVFAPLFGHRVQFFGLWMVLGVIGSGVAAVLVCRPWLPDATSLALAGCLFVMNSVVATRAGHPPFFALWELIGLVGACLWPVGSLEGARRVAGVTILLGFLAGGTNAYLAVMAALLVGASLARLVLVARAFKAPEALAWLAAGPAAVLGSLWLFGYVSGVRSSPMGNLAIEGFGQFSADLLTFVNPLQWSRFLKPIAMGGRQYEGFAYLGLGTLLLLAVRLALLTRLRPSRAEVLTFIPLAVACGLMAAYAPSSVVTVAGRPIANLTSFYDRLAPWPSVFRSSGRFVWPLFCWLTLTAALAFARVRRAGVRQLALGGGVLLQLLDFNVGATQLHKQYPAFEEYRDPAWQLMKDYRHVIIHPIQIQWTCSFDHVLVSKLSWEAVKQGLSINSGHVGRAPPGTDCTRHLTPGELRDDAVYVPYFQQYLGDFQSAGFVCGLLEQRVAVCVSPRRQTPLLQELLRRTASK